MTQVPWQWDQQASGADFAGVEIQWLVGHLEIQQFLHRDLQGLINHYTIVINSLHLRGCLIGKSFLWKGLLIRSLCCWTALRSCCLVARAPECIPLVCPSYLIFVLYFKIFFHRSLLGWFVRIWTALCFSCRFLWYQQALVCECHTLEEDHRGCFALL